MPVHLTFDDVPNRFTDALDDILLCLKSRNICADFFIVGKKAEKRASDVLKIMDHGHGIQNHSWSHRNFLLLADDDIRDEVLATNELIYKITGIVPRYFRPPYGGMDDRVKRLIEQLGMVVIKWDASASDSIKSDGPLGGGIKKSCVSNMSQNGVVLLHQKPNTARDLHWFLDALLDKEFTRLPDV